MIRRTTKIKLLVWMVGFSFGMGLLVSLFGGLLKRQWHVQRRKLKLKARLAEIDAEKVRLEEELREVED